MAKEIRILTFLAVLAVVVNVASAATKVLYSFGGGSDGEYTDTDLVIDNAGNLYGTSVQGGNFSSGTIFRLSPSINGWVHTVLYSFTGGADGGEPYKGATLDAQGNIYATAGVGGRYVGPCSDTGCGTVFKLTRSGDTYIPRVIHSFTGGTDGFGPGSGVTVDQNGNIYGLTPTGGTYGFGVVYELIRNNTGSYTERIIHAFTGGDDGLGASAGRLIFDKAGNLYGVTTVGGRNGAGVVFELLRTASGFWGFKTLFSFNGEPDAGFPYGALVFDTNGNLYGTTYYAGQNDLGSVYELTRQNSTWNETLLYSFKGGTDGSGPISNLVFDAHGNLYGTTSEGGSSKCGGCGTIFKLTRGQNGSWTESVMHRFTGPPDGAFVYNGMVGDSVGNFYGATVHGGSGDDGAIYRFTP